MDDEIAQIQKGPGVSGPHSIFAYWLTLALRYCVCCLSHRERGVNAKLLS